jgi:glycine/D-amino acid oxidase-like deaminating enzyme
MTRDLIVVGCGIVGASIALAAQRAGLRTELVEAAFPGTGVSAAGMGHLVVLDGAELALSARSLELWRELLEREPGLSEYRRTGTLWVAENGTELAALARSQDRLRAAGVPSELRDAAGLAREEPALASDLAGGLLLAGDGIVYPPKAVHQILSCALALGARIRTGQRATALTGDGVVLEGNLRLSGEVVIATGPSGPELLPELPLVPRKGHLVITEATASPPRHQIVEAGYTRGLHAPDGLSVAMNVQPRPTGQLLIGSSRESGLSDSEVSPEVLAAMLGRVLRFLPGLGRLSALRTWTGLRPATPDGLPYIGRVPGRRGVWAALGHEGLGITTAPATAELLVDGILGRKSILDPAPYDPARCLG